MSRVVVVTPLFPLSGQPYSGRSIYETARALQRYADVRVLCPIAVYPLWSTLLRPRFRSRLDPTHAPPGVEVTCFPYPAVPLVSRPFNGEVCARRLYPYLQNLCPDVVLSYWLYPEGFAACKAGHALGLPVIAGARGSDIRLIPGPVTRKRVSETLRQADYILTVSEDLRGRAIQLGARPERSKSILNGCDRDIFQLADRRAAREAFGISTADKVVLYVGRFARTKGIMELVAAFSALAEELPNLKLVCVGSGPLQSVLETQIKERVRIPGDQSLSEVARWMVAADLFCLPSYSEGCPNVVIEAISCGCPVVATDVGGIPELVNPDCAILVPSKNVDRLTDALRSSLSRSWDRNAIGAMFRRTWDQVARETIEVCEQVLKSGPRALSAGS
ncbi:MAG TPA: glycosyltransferase [Bryobacteraceae bacterium]|nr:glycosyltransferase [Bryobacteraceae bacterium]